MKIRTFIAVDIDRAVAKSLTKILRQLAQTGAPVNWVDPRHFHVTLKFLGEIVAEDTARLGAILSEAADAMGPFEIEVRGLGAFPPLEKNSKPRVVWAGADDEEGFLKEMARRLDALCYHELGVRPENKGFIPHVTLGRVKGSQGLESLVDKLKTLADTDFGVFRADRVVAYQSSLTPEGPEYVPLASMNL